MKRNFALKRQKVIDEEVNKLLVTKFIHEVHYPNWLANIIIVKKVNKKWWICIDYTDLYRAYSKDSFLLLKIDQLVDATFGHKLFSFMDTFSSYNQIKIALKDEENTS